MAGKQVRMLLSVMLGSLLSNMLLQTGYISYLVANSTSHTVPLWLQSQHCRECRLRQLAEDAHGQFIVGRFVRAQVGHAGSQSCTTSAMCTGRSIDWHSSALTMDTEVGKHCQAAGMHWLVRGKVGFFCVLVVPHAVLCL